ncbi:hypothetical protein PHYBLDRAFT_163168 [Phycomyces blakesleeanus NRRL 1555(-)]|uniref:Uncharacterized protein n=1 Tax=Phycomyces blakesleeanus (strain ATCC 8743b / DSM 1359 / FGSC 10004 / NBRC 33097 / NRRL 1555) TaxID=763407 RepID=A0A167QR92_PHYB8|nr:hypothetical protein PHYBLDRAFT_163168 [Phycomyces blakesleeanus NRRL 1555(-)]OAD80121.1 hypothetical protein PHYBLDRAFT_163168 [Phycomyces blakesleeanus NRRL 1555(-)]|eukprot:XP_018298161.1 hypothetical protein PHYBLDRAFT_163168 [Phycomyces blakesleeanus NRRL 1555(-)]
MYLNCVNGCVQTISIWSYLSCPTMYVHAYCSSPTHTLFNEKPTVYRFIWFSQYRHSIFSGQSVIGPRWLMMNFAFGTIRVFASYKLCLPITNLPCDEKVILGSVANSLFFFHLIMNVLYDHIGAEDTPLNIGGINSPGIDILEDEELNE